MGWLFEPARLRLIVAMTLVGWLLTQGFVGCVLNREGGLGAQCSADSECDDQNPCTADSCSPEGACVQAPIDAPLGQVEGDCLVYVCQAGAIDTEPADDPEDDGEVCTEDVCVDGQTQHDPLPLNGEPCTAPEGPGTCGGGTCQVICEPGDPCDDQNDCTDDFCNGQTGICDHSTLPDGPLAEALQEDGDCRLRICTSGEESNVFDNLDVPEYPDEPCRFGICDNGVPKKAQLPTGDPCQDATDPLAQLCNGVGECVECIGPTDCPGQDTQCRTRTCSPAGSCGEICTPNGTPLNVQVPANCEAEICDGMCGETSTPDATDVFVDGLPCTEDLCVNGSTVNPPSATGTPCGNGGVCNATGVCVGCNVAADCGSDTFCLSWSCVSSMCQGTSTPNDTPLPAAQQTPQDCVELRCDGNGGVKQSLIDDPIVDGNPCTDDLCNNGSPINPASMLDQPCMTTMYCDGNGACVQCNDDGQCTSDDGVCEEDKCLANSCSIVNDPATDPGPSNVIGDCQTFFCDGMGDENPLPTVDDGDLPDDMNECTLNQCTNGMIGHPPVPAGDPCSTGVCNGDPGAPACVECATSADCPMGQTCNTTTWTCFNDNGQGCVAPTDCLSGFCVDGVCCDAACGATCFACDVPNLVGTCSPVPFNVDLDDECAGGACNGMGICKLSDGQLCGAGGDCLSDECADGVCCDGPCNGTCEACDLSGSIGACQLVPSGADPDSECAAGACDGGGLCKLDLGEPCGAASDCLSNACADGVCCDTACTGTCEACGAAGVCTPHADGTDPENECSVPTTADVCNGAGACRCVDGSANGGESDVDCGGPVCGACMDGQLCNGPSDCASGVCTGGVCQAPACGDGVVNGTEACDYADPSTPCCSIGCGGTAAAGESCGPDPDGTGCTAPPKCDGLGQAPANCLAPVPELPGTLCTDNGLYCDGIEACDAGGACVSPGDPCDGPDGDGDCSETCDEGANACTGNDASGEACDDGLWCNGTDSCDGAGTCGQHSGDPCPGANGDGNCAESCDEAIDMCTLADPAGSPCDDGLFCNGDDFCDGGGMCLVHDGDPCPGPNGDGDCNQSCDEGAAMCTAYDGDGAACDDGTFCNGADSCLGGTCSVNAGDPCPGPDMDPNCNESCDEAMASCTAYDGDGAACMQGMNTMCSGGTCSSM